jgi:hypothetical protein
MNPNQPTSSSNRVAILASSLVLQKLHGSSFAVLFLRQYGFDDYVVAELLGLQEDLNRIVIIQANA